MEEIKKKEEEGYAELLEKRRIEIEENRKNFRKVRFEDKLKKRHLSREICSEVLDLIFDIANEANDH